MRRLLLACLLAPGPLAFAGGGGTVFAKGQPFLAEVAVTDPEHARGLMYRQQLAKDRCMIFLYGEDGNITIWMKNCLIALDVAWMKADGTVVELAERVPPPSPMFRGSDEDLPRYGGSKLARHFVEFPAGTFKRIGLRVGERLGWDLSLDDGTRVVGGAPAPAKPAKKGKRK